MRKWVKWVGLILIGLLFLFALGPRPNMPKTSTLDAANIPEAPDQLVSYLAKQESAFANLRPGAAKEIIWANPNEPAKTPYSVIYLHGFSASKMETQPVSQNLAKALGANLYLARLTGHGMDGEALGNATLQEWLNDTAEALAIGKRLGEKVILVSASTGSTLSTWAASQPQLATQFDAMAMISPNFAIKAAPTALLNMPWAETILPIIFGKERTFEPVNEGHKAGWTHQYPSKAIFPMAALLRLVDSVDVAVINKPAFFVFSDNDKVIDPARVEAAIARWGGKTTVLKVNDSKDPYSHVIAGDILSPNTTQAVSKAMIEWAVGL